MTVTITAVEGSGVAALAGRLDLRNAADVSLRLADLLHDAGTLTVDLTGIDFIDSSGLGALIGLQRQATREGKSLTIVPPEGPAREIFSLTRTDAYFTMATAAA